MSLTLASPVGEIRGVGAATVRALASGGVAVVADLLWTLPYRYEDRSNTRPIASLGGPGQVVTVAGRLADLTARRARNRRMHVTEGVVDDGTGALPVVWFNQPYLAKSLSVGTRLWLHGPLKPGRRWGLQMVAPEWEAEDQDASPVHLGRIVPIYRRVGVLSGRRLRALLARVLDDLPEPADAVLPWLPRERELPALAVALRTVHFPRQPDGEAALAALLGALAEAATPAHRRLAFEELLGLALALERERRSRKARRAPSCVVTDEVREKARTALPFRLTGAQRRVLAEIVADLGRSWPMARLLQGDVGSGKTVVAALAALVAIESGLQVALLAPTELLASQHFATLGALLGPTGRAPALLVGSLRAREKEKVRTDLAGGRARLVVGTHALLEDEVVFARLGLVIVDEQHRFGVTQRRALVRKGAAPHLLVMTATPIPRSLALSVDGDLEVSLLDELPPGRTPVRTVLRDDAARDRLLGFLRRELVEGGQVYWVFPVIEESEKQPLRAVETHARAVGDAFPGTEVGVVHGRLAAEARDAVMASFASGAVRVLCATTVIEVGVDVPNASVMVVENAERFGLAQLHQLRGRVGRGRRRSFCVLLAGPGCSADARRRLEILAATGDGFRIAEEDFRLRGPGEITGLRQWGRPELRVADLWRHRAELALAREVAAAAADAGRMEELAGALSRPAMAGATVLTG